MSLVAIPRQQSLTFQRMCEFAAIMNSQSFGESLNRLVLHCLFVFQDRTYNRPEQVKEAIYQMTGIQLPDHRIQEALDQLIAKDEILRDGTNYVLSPSTRQDISRRIDQTRLLEQHVRDAWQDDIEQRFPGIDPHQAWSALTAYLAQAFRRHGIQATALLDPSLEMNGQANESLSQVLNTVVASHFEADQRETAQASIAGFLAVGHHSRERALYIAQLADGAFNFSVLSVDPAVADQLRQQLSPLTLFLDTNFLFGLLKLHASPHIDVSTELVQTKAKHNLPFDFCYHRLTEREMRHTIEIYADRLRNHRWRAAISRAAVQARYLSGIEQQFHQAHLAYGVDIETFLKPVEHFDVLLADQGIRIYEDPQERLKDRANLYHEYDAFLQRMGIEKGYHPIDHDVTVLDAVRMLRNNAKSSLEAGALFITCDYRLYRFDWENSREHQVRPCMVLPNIFWQVLRPFIPNDNDFDKAFADTFALPEFRSLGSGTAKAASKLVATLNTYKDIPEETAARMLANDLLIDGLRRLNNDQEIQAYIETEIAKDNALLVEKNAALLRQAQLARREATQVTVDLQAEREERSQAELAAQMVIRTKEGKYQTTIQEMEGERNARLRVERRLQIYGTLAAVACSILLIIGSEWLIYNLPWTWIINHQRSGALRITAYLTTLLLMVGLLVPATRKVVWGGGIISALIAVLLGAL
jgi:hypothetical protein